jgi:hypothetical protein
VVSKAARPADESLGDVFKFGVLNPGKGARMALEDAPDLTSFNEIMCAGSLRRGLFHGLLALDRSFGCAAVADVSQVH